MEAKRSSNFWIILTLGILVVALAAYEFLASPKLHGMVIKPRTPMPDFTLEAAGGPVTLSNFRGKLVILYFGYTSCPDLCPTTLAILREATQALGDKAREVQVIFISVDWKRDTPEHLASYAARFNPSFLGLTGSQIQIDTVTKGFGITYLLNPPDASGYYAVDHTSNTLVLDQQGRLAVIWPYDTQATEIVEDLQYLLSNPE